MFAKGVPLAGEQLATSKLSVASNTATLTVAPTSRPWRSGQAEPQKPFEKLADVKDRGPTFGAPFHNWDQAFNPQRS